MVNNPAPPSVTTAADRALVERLVGFANQPPPDDPAAVEEYFWAHPFAARSPFWKSLRNVPRAQAVAAFQAEHTQLREALAAIARDDVAWRIAERPRLKAQLEEALSIPFEVENRTFRIPLGRPTVDLDRRGIRLGFEPFLTGVGAAIGYGLALLLDPRRDVVRAFRQCSAPKGDRACGRFFWRSSARRYCSDVCAQRAKRAAVTRRVQAWRRRHPDWYAREKRRRERKRRTGHRP